MMESALEREAALRAAHEAAEAIPALLAFAREGEAIPAVLALASNGTGWAFDIEVAAHLGIALKAVLGIELPRMARRAADADADGLDGTAEAEAGRALEGALDRFLELWA